MTFLMAARSSGAKGTAMTVSQEPRPALKVRSASLLAAAWVVMAPR